MEDGCVNQGIKHTGYRGGEVSSGRGWWQFLDHTWMSLNATALYCKVANLCDADFATAFKKRN